MDVTKGVRLNVSHQTKDTLITEQQYRIEALQKELTWYRTYGQYIAHVHTNVDAEACGYADGDNEYSLNK